MSDYHLAQLNLAALKFPLDSPELKDFVDNLESVNALAESMSGFVWRLQDEAGNATGIQFFGDEVIVNMSVWQDVASLHNFVYKTPGHTNFMRRRKEWFERIEQAYTVLWWIPKNTLPTLEQSKNRLEHLRAQGATEQAFTFKQAFPAPDSDSYASNGKKPFSFDDLCPT